MFEVFRHFLVERHCRVRRQLQFEVLRHLLVEREELWLGLRRGRRLRGLLLLFFLESNETVSRHEHVDEVLCFVEHVALNLSRLDRLGNELHDLMVEVDLLCGTDFNIVPIKLGRTIQVLTRRLRLEVVAKGIDALPKEEVLDTELLFEMVSKFLEARVPSQHQVEVGRIVARKRHGLRSLTGPPFEYPPLGLALFCLELLLSKRKPLSMFQATCQAEHVHTARGALRLRSG